MALQHLKLPISVNVGARYFAVIDDGDHRANIKTRTVQRNRVGLLKAHAHPACSIGEVFIETCNQGASHSDGTGDTNHDTRQRHQTDPTGHKLPPKRVRLSSFSTGEGDGSGGHLVSRLDDVSDSAHGVDQCRP